MTLNLTCGDGTGSGCFWMQFSNDGTNWSALEHYSATRAAHALSAGDGTKLVYVKYQDSAGNLSAPAPLPSSSTPPHRSQRQCLPAAPTAPSRSWPSTCNDGAGIGCGDTYYSTDGSLPSIPYTAPITMGKNGVIKYFSRDLLGNAEVVKTADYSFIQGYTELNFELSQPTTTYDGTITDWGRLVNMSTNNADPTGEQITITITDPTGSSTTRTATIYDPLGLFMLENITGCFTHKGAYTITASFAGSSLLSSSTSDGKTLLVGASAGYAVLIEGKIANEEGLGSHNKTANRIYQKMKARGFEDDNIYYFNYDLGQPGVDAIPSLAAVQSVIETWAKARMNGLPAPLYLIMVDHGSPNSFHINNEIITPTLLATWLSNLESGLSAEALLEKRWSSWGPAIGNLHCTSLRGSRSR